MYDAVFHNARLNNLIRIHTAALRNNRRPGTPARLHRGKKREEGPGTGATLNMLRRSVNKGFVYNGRQGNPASPNQPGHS